MNFQQVEQGNGKLVQMFGVFTEIGGLQYTPQQKAKAICKIRDDTGVEHNVHIYQGKGQLPSPEQFNQRCQFNLSTFQGTYQNKPYTGYSGFWQQPQGQSHKPQQGSQNVPQSPNGLKDDREGKLVRNNLVCAYIQAGKEPIIADVNYWIAFIVTGKAPLPLNKQGSESGDDSPY